MNAGVKKDISKKDFERQLNQLAMSNIKGQYLNNTEISVDNLLQFKNPTAVYETFDRGNSPMDPDSPARAQSKGRTLRIGHLYPSFHGVTPKIIHPGLEINTVDKNKEME